MKYRALGDTGITVSEIGFGAWGIGGETADGPNSYGKTDDGESRRALMKAFDLGITFYDTSNLYGYGHSEELIGETLHSVRQKIVIASKVGFLAHRGPHDFSEKHVRKSLEGSLKRLHTDYVDLYQLHSPPIKFLEDNPNILNVFESLQKEGKIKVFGISVQHPSDALIAINELGFKSVQVNFNMIDQRVIENGFLGLAKKHKTGIIARTPLNFGFLSGKLVNARFDPRDHRSVWSEVQLKRWAEAPRLFSFLFGGGMTPVQAALNFCLSFPAISSVIPGMLTSAEVEENVAASGMPRFTKAEIEKARGVYAHNEFFMKNVES